MPLLFVLIVIIAIVLLSEKNNKKKSNIVNILTVPSGEIIKIKRKEFDKLRSHGLLTWHNSHRYWTIRDKNRKVI